MKEDVGAVDQSARNGSPDGEATALPEAAGSSAANAGSQAVASLTVTAIEFQSVSWESGWPPFKSVGELFPEFYRRANDAQRAGDEIGRRVYQALGHAMSFHVKLDDEREVYQPFLRLEGQRSAVVEDLSDDTYRAFGTIATTIDNMLVRARLADLSWVRVRDYGAALTAIDATLNLVVSQDMAENLHILLPNLERVFQVAARLGKKAAQIDKVSVIVDAIICAPPGDDGFLTLKLSKLFVKYAQPDLERLERIASERSLTYARSNSWRLAQEYAEFSTSCATERRDIFARKMALRIEADLFVREAEELMTEPAGSRIVPAHLLTHAVELLRRAGSTEDAMRLYKRLREVQRETTRDLCSFSYEVDLTAPMERTEAYFSGRSLDEAMLAFARLRLVPNKFELREQADGHSRDFPLSHLMTCLTIDADGKVIDRRSSALTEDSADWESAVRAEMIGLLERHVEIIARARIRPAVLTITREHDIRLAHCIELVRANPVIGEKRELLVAEGLFAGFTLDFPKALHIMLPQFEHALRVLLEHAGVDASKMDAEHRQEDRNLNWLLYRPELSAILGQDMVFAMQGLLVEKAGPNLRNRMAHGLLDYADCFSGVAISAWWIMYRFFSIPMLYAAAHESANHLRTADSAVERDYVEE